MLVVLLAVMVVQRVLVLVLCVAGVASQAVAVSCPPIWESSYQWTVSVNAIDAASGSIPRGHSGECHVYARKLHFLFLIADSDLAFPKQGDAYLLLVL